MPASASTTTAHRQAASSAISRGFPTLAIPVARSFREIGDEAADLPQEMLAAFGGLPGPLRRRIPVPSEKRIRTLLKDLDDDALERSLQGS